MHGIIDDARLELVSNAAHDDEVMSPIQYFRRRVDSYLDILSKTKLSPIDSMHFALELKRAAFSEYEREFNIELSLVKDNEQYAEDKEAGLSAIITTANVAISDEFEYNQNEYYYYVPGKTVTDISKYDLKKKIENGSLELMEDEHTIPGIGVRYESVPKA